MNKNILLICGAILLLILIIGCTEPTCGDKKCDANENISTSNNYCPNDCDTNTPATITNDGNLPDVPWSAFYMHVEDTVGYDQCFDQIIALADKYNTPLTLMLHARIRDHILEDPIKIAKLQTWQANGHEFGIHAQGCFGSDYCDDPGSCLKEGDAKQYTKLIGARNLKTAHVTPALMGYGEENTCPELLPDTIIYGGLGRMDGRNAVSIKYNIEGKIFDLLNVKAGYFDANPEKMAQYNNTNSNEIYFTGNHAECDLTELEEWFQFLSEKDPEGKKRKTQTWLMENVIIPEGRSINENELTSSTDPKITKCLQLIGGKVFTDALGYSPTDIFNFGRCITNGTFCYNDEKCGDGKMYVPTKCTIGDIDNIAHYKPVSEVCVVECGDGACDRGEDRLDSEIYCSSDCEIQKYYCGDGLCREKDEEDLETCPQDCLDGHTEIPPNTCGNGVCEEKELDKGNCPEDCLT